ncbi:MAG: hypothetical protein NTW04_03745, partial [Elusimicrobia bacterium]|nr:hypothetical protein [Elusimicrobiota bacterium]
MKKIMFSAVVILAACLVSANATMTQTNPTLKLLKFDYTPEQIAQVGETAKAGLEANLAQIIKVHAGERTFKNTVAAYDSALADYREGLFVPAFLTYVSPLAEIRDAAGKLEEGYKKNLVEIGTRKELYNALNEVAQKKPVLNEIDQRLLDRFMLDFKRNGL